MRIRSISASLVLVSLVVLAAGCGEAVKPPADTPIIRKSTQTLVSTNKCSATSTECTGQAVEVVMTLDKTRILGREFMYNLDLQYSSQFDEGYNLYTQSEVIGNTPVVFRIMGNTLELVTDNKLKFPSDNNHPEDIIGRFRILSQTDSTLTVSGLNSAPYLATQMAAASGSESDSDEKAAKPSITYLDHWIRSFEFDPNGNYLLQETSLKLSDGKTIVEFMESIYPRETLKPGANFEKFEMDPEDPVGAAEGTVARFRFLPADTITLHDKTSEKKLAFAEHYDISGADTTIDWYVTPNIPDEYIAPVKQAVEGWNRYFVKMKGIERPVMRFMGKLPANIHIGDPRYNVINWDSRLIAGAAYESQAADPETGRQSHSVIYMPAAWLKIGTDYWAKGIGSDTQSGPAPAPGAGVRASRNVRCSRDLADAARLLASGRVLEDDLKNFGVELLKQTLFHEVGHALGFAHNFKGSLSYDPADSKSMFSTSIMDYNDYEIERGAFFDVNSEDGPLLEYDRQLMSALYNKGQDISAKDVVLPACNDAEADNEDKGVDPLCIRYDIEKDPTASIAMAIHRVEDAQVDSRNVSLSQALSRIAALTLSDEKLQSAKKKEDVQALTKKFAGSLKGSLDFYIVSDVAALARTVRTNVKALLEIGGTLPEGYDAQKMRESVFTGIQKVLSMTDLPAAPKKAYEDAAQAGLARLALTPFAQSQPEAERPKLSAEASKAIAQEMDAFLKDTDKGLPAARAKLITALARHKKVDFFAGKLEDKKDSASQQDYETAIVSLLADITSSVTRTSVERIAAAKALATYKDRGTGEKAIDAIRAGLLAERDASPASNDARRTIESVVKALGLKKSH
ncbi:MAG: zinc-dependent metalloprotease [Bdellovibrionia bacterium]